MLSEAEQRKLSEIESRLRAEDPTFAQRFGDREQPRLRPRWRGLVALFAVAVAVTVTVAVAVVVLISIGASRLTTPSDAKPRSQAQVCLGAAGAAWLRAGAGGG